MLPKVVAERAQVVKPVDSIGCVSQCSENSNRFSLEKFCTLGVADIEFVGHCLLELVELSKRLKKGDGRHSVHEYDGRATMGC